MPTSFLCSASAASVELQRGQSQTPPQCPATAQKRCLKACGIVTCKQRFWLFRVGGFFYGCGGIQSAAHVMLLGHLRVAR
jgi:hypothetical protein